MADTAQSVITDAYQKLKIYAPGVTVTAADLQTGMTNLNKMLDAWSNDKLACFANVEQSFTLTPGVNQYTIGSGGTINVTRPITINTGMGAAYIVDTNNVRYPLNVIEQDQWNTINLLTIQSSLPDTLFYDPQYPLGKINIFPTPSAAYTVYIDSRLQLVDITTLNQAFSLPPGYIDAIVDNLAVKLWPYFKQGDPTPGLMMAAGESLAKIKRSNIRMSPSVYDSAVVSKAASQYNIYSDSATGGRSLG